MLPLKDLKPNPKNPRLIKDAQFKKLVDSLREFPEMSGVREIVVNKDMVILGGNMRYRAMKEAGWKEAPVKIVDWPQDKQDEFIIKDNVSGGEWDWERLANDWDVAQLTAWGVELPDSLGSVDQTIEDEAPDLDAAKPAISKQNETYQLGRHRLMCGDSSDFGALSDLMDGRLADMVFTDPPYGINYSAKNRLLNSYQKAGRNLTPIANDNLGNDELHDLLVKVFSNVKEVSQDHCSYYVTAPPGGELGLMMMMMMNSGLAVKHMLIWNKNNQNFSLGRLDYEYKHEPILYTWNKKHHFYGRGKFKNSVWDIDKPRQAKEHPTMKPVELVANALMNSSQKDDVVLDVFGGSGTTLIACEQLDRTCYMMELEPKYADVIRKRWVKYAHGEEALENDKWIELTPIAT